MMILRVIKQLFKKPFTNKFPAKYAPSSTTKFLQDIEAGKVEIIPPIEIPSKFRGAVSYDRDKCIGCQLCTRVCPSQAIEFKPEEKKIKIFMARCTFCSQCVEVCPVNALEMSDNWLLANEDKYAEGLIVE
ncbi:MAG: 4Fe-4S binding protein [Euryarchaeota archaeon]|nr:4Fe-4S binding protein [Euryarchaeota archaeon]